MTPERIAELTSLLERAGPAEWCAVIPPDIVDPDTYAYGYGQLRTSPADDGGWSLLLKVDDYDEQDAVLEFCAEAKNAMPEILAELTRLYALEDRVIHADVGDVRQFPQPTGAAT